ncbi:MAG TPA: ABC transporter permease [Candidatus Baltobacteraceae bacterium]
MNTTLNDFVVVYSTEIARRIKSRPFQIGLILGLVGIFVFSELPGWVQHAAGASQKTIVLAGAPALTAPAKKLLAQDDFVVAATVEQSTAPTSAGLDRYHAASWLQVAQGPRGLKLTVYTKDPANVPSDRVKTDLIPLSLELASSMSQARIQSLLDAPITIKSVAAKFGSAAQATAAHGVASALLFFLYLLILINSQLVMSAVAEEKTSRIAELLVASVSPIPLLYGKIAAAATLGLMQMVIWVAEAAYLGSHAATTVTAAASGHASSGLGSLTGSVTTLEIVCFVLFFFLGFLQLATLFAGVGSLINRTEDLGSISLPLIVPVMAGFVISIAALDAPDVSWVVATSFVPLLAPFVMFARIAVSDVPLWQIGTSLIINAVALWGIAWMAGKLYRVGMLLYGRAPSLGQIWQVLRS